MSDTTRIPVWKRALFASIVALALLGTAEGVCRLLIPLMRNASVPDAELRAHLAVDAYEYDPDLGWYWDALPTFSVNVHGFRRTAPMTIEPAPGVTRVVTLGDSQTFGGGVAGDETYSAAAGRLLGDDWEVLNGGISGYKSLNVYRLLRRRIVAFEPHIVMVDCFPLDSPRDDGPLMRLPLEASFANRLIWHSALLYSLRYAWDKYGPGRPRRLDRPATSLPGDAGGFGNHDLIAEWCKERGIVPVFMEYPATFDDFVLMCHTRAGELPEGVAVVPACQALVASGHTGRELFQDRNHLTVLGNEIVGEALAETLETIGQVGSL